MKATAKERVFQHWVTSLLGVAIMVFAGYYFFLNLKTLTLENVLIGAILGSVGFIFLFVKDSLITGLFKKKIT
jgi:hypothetical protein